jgi:preprotein translocase subunit SecG
MAIAITILHILTAILLVLIVLIQGGENVDITAAFGGVSQAAFGPRGAVSTLAKMTWVLGVVFAATSLTLSIWATRRTSGSVMETAPRQSAPSPKKTIPVLPPVPKSK